MDTEDSDPGGLFARASMLFKSCRQRPTVNEYECSRTGDFDEAIATELMREGLTLQAIAAYDTALAKGVTINRRTRWNRSLALLKAGLFERGWPEYEIRRSEPHYRAGSDRVPDVSELPGSPIIIRPEQGLGDVVQFARYAKQLHSIGAHVTLECPYPLLKLMHTCDGVDEIVLEGTPRYGDYDFAVPVMSLPLMFSTYSVADIPASIPYLSAEIDRIREYRSRLQPLGKLTVGVSWQGNPHHPLDRERSIPVSRFMPLGRLPGIQLVSIQRGPGIEQLDSLDDAPCLIELLDRRVGDPDAMAEQAALMTAVDVVISVDSATAHVAGALGCPTWVVLPKMADWRWLHHRSDSPWYPTMMLFRQADAGDWDGVFKQAAERLMKLVQQQP